MLFKLLVEFDLEESFFPGVTVLGFDGDKFPLENNVVVRVGDFFVFLNGYVEVFLAWGFAHFETIRGGADFGSEVDFSCVVYLVTADSNLFIYYDS